MMNLIRWILGKVILTFDRLFKPTPVQRSPEDQARVDEKCAALALYQFEACPFCVKVRRGIRRMNLKIELRDAKREERFAKELVAGGGELQVPCLKIRTPQGTTQWMYESTDILNYLADLAR